MFPALVADIGGTNARFALVTGVNKHGFVFESAQTLSTNNYSSFADVVEHYLQSLKGIDIHHACFAVAGPVSGDYIEFTNLDWGFSKQDFSRRFGFKVFEVINDFFAVAMACPSFTDEDLISLKPGVSCPDGVKAALGPGTGLGVAGLVKQGALWQPVPCEGGHVNIAPTTPLECDVLKAGMALYGHVSAETFLCGPGLVNLYRALAEVKGVAVDPISPAQITSSAVADDESADPLCNETFAMFCSWLGNFAGNLALTYGASGGIYLAGGILPRFVDFVQASDFVKCFSDKGNMSDYLTDIPVQIIGHPQTAFVGAAGWLKQVTQS
ncbi:glucokinase [Teredinibacter sp. KSP-S5-2]|uniref:glucokinase n=1 Tax=Teredinibacter sp. KSP-S5-2 TaxID=3034506 RepID=UPI002934630E|nr:glucokinase [Teredinibacter sp. KSP-S5-2]WNO09782.1 glucokinase [Teredinibacter sp. KSP-S5-2]